MAKAKNEKDIDYQEFLSSAKIPQNNVIDLKKLLVEQEEEEKKSDKSFFNNFYNKLKPEKKRKKEKVKKTNNWQISWKSIAVFSGICLFLLIPLTLMVSYQSVDNIKGRVMGVSVSALENLKSAGSAITLFEIDEAKKEFILAEEGFDKAQEELSSVNKILLFLLKLVPFKGSVISSGEHLIEAGKNISEIGRIISEKIEPISNQNLFDKNELVISQIIFSLAGSVDDISEKIIDTKKHLEKVNVSSLPEEYREEVERVKAIMPDLENYITYLKTIFEVSTELVGFNGEKEYIFIFQNNTEIRPTGGFIGSLALVKAENGQIKIIEVPSRGSYEINDDFLEEIIPPRPLWLINNNWQIQDANWFPDFPASAQKINWFYERARGYQVDGIISFTPDIITDLLEVTGPIPMDKYELTLTSDNFVRETQKQVELEYDEAVNRPKQIISDLMPILISKVMQLKPENFSKLIEVLSNSVKEKDILIYVEDENLESKVKQLNWAGEIKQAERDYLMLVNTNIGGGKTDQVIDQELSVQTKIHDDGSVINTIKLLRTHQGDSDDIFTKIKNINYLRFYVPEGSELIEASGFDEIDKNLLIYPSAEAKDDEFLLSVEKDPIIHERSNTRITTEFGKTVFGNWQGLEVGESKEVIIKYKLPFKIFEEKDLYTLYLQKQPGSKNYEVKTELTVSSNFEIIDTSTNEEVSNNYIKHADILTWDKAYGVILKKK